jgi:hypothetical protein
MSTLHKKLYLEIKRNDKLDENNKNKKLDAWKPILEKMIFYYR